MGYYINPQFTTKEQWLWNNARRVLDPLPPTLDCIDKDECLICLVGNDTFTAAGIIHKPSELDDWADPKDYRPKKWYIADRELVTIVSNINLEDFKL